MHLPVAMISIAAMFPTTSNPTRRNRKRGSSYYARLRRSAGLRHRRQARHLFFAKRPDDLRTAAGGFTENSDVDLAVEGLDESRYFTALADLMALFGGPVDLIRVESAAGSLKDRSASEGHLSL
jgi:hypothetical protein